MNSSHEETQLVRARQSGLGCLKRLVQLLFLAIVAVGVFAFGYATGSGVAILAPANAIIETAIASFPDPLQTLAEDQPRLDGRNWARERHRATAARSQLSQRRRPPSAGHLEYPGRRARESLLAL